MPNHEQNYKCLHLSLYTSSPRSGSLDLLGCHSSSFDQLKPIWKITSPLFDYSSLLANHVRCWSLRISFCLRYLSYSEIAAMRTPKNTLWESLNVGGLDKHLCRVLDSAFIALFHFLIGVDVLLGLLSSAFDYLRVWGRLILSGLSFVFSECCCLDSLVIYPQNC